MPKNSTAKKNASAPKKGPSKYLKVDLARLVAYCSDEKIDVPAALIRGGDDSRDELVAHVSAALASKFSVDPMECTECKFPSPDVPQIPKCPGCGVVFAVADADGDNVVVLDHPAAAPDEGSAVAVTGSSTSEGKVAAQDLDRLTGEVVRLHQDLVTHGWEVGVRLAEVFDRSLWQVRHESFAAYVEAECGFTYQNAKELIRIARTFQREQIDGLRLSQLRLLSKVPDEAERERLVAEVREDRAANREAATFKETAAKVKEAREDLGLPTERKGMEREASVQIAGRLKPGVVAEGAWQKYERGAGTAKLEIAGVTFKLEVTRDGFSLSLPKPRPKK